MKHGIVLTLLLSLFQITDSGAVLFKSTGDPTYNTTAPGGTLTNSGWQFEGSWGSYLGTPIASNFFIAAQHVNSGNTNWNFVLNGVTYHPVSFANCPNADLTVWQVAETFPYCASLYSATNEVGRYCVVFGRGTQRGSPVIVNGSTNGWYWGTSDGVERWGDNIVAAIENGGASLGQLLYCTFDSTGDSNECHISVGDSSGALFIQDGSVWKLAGLHYGVDGPFSTNAAGATPFYAALLNERGLYEDEGGSWIFRPFSVPSGFVSTRISANLNWISNAITNMLIPYTYTTNSDNTINITGYTGSGGAVTVTNMIGGLLVTSIGSSAFMNCANLTSVTLPASISSIGSSAFAGCTGLTGVYFQGNAPGDGTDTSVFSGDTQATVDYLAGTTGFSATFDGLATAEYGTGVPTMPPWGHLILALALLIGIAPHLAQTRPSVPP